MSRVGLLTFSSPCVLSLSLEYRYRVVLVMNRYCTKDCPALMGFETIRRNSSMNQAHGSSQSADNSQNLPYGISILNDGENRLVLMDFLGLRGTNSHIYTRLEMPQSLQNTTNSIYSAMASWITWLSRHMYPKSSTSPSRCLPRALIFTASITGSCEGCLHTESKYLCDGITTWITNWEKRGRKNAKKKMVENADLWKRLKAVSEKHQIKWVWTPKEAASAGYEREDAIELAQRAMEEYSR